MKGLRALVTVGVLATIAVVAVPGTGSAQSGDREKATVVLRTTNGFYVDNDPQGSSAGDLFGGSGELRRQGEVIGRFSSACTATSEQLDGQCQATLRWHGRGRLQLAGIVNPQRVHNKLSIIGGVGEFRRAHGVARLERQDEEGTRQRATLLISY